jgi:hypothetical protein
MTETYLVGLNDETSITDAQSHIDAQTGADDEPSVGATSSEQTAKSEVEQAAALQAALLEQEAKNTLAALKQQEQHKLNTALAELKSKSAVSVTSPVAHEGQAQSASVNDIKAISSLEQLLMKGPLLDPLAGLEKIQGVHKVQLDTLLTQINATLDSDESLTSEDGS